MEKKMLLGCHKLRAGKITSPTLIQQAVGVNL